MRVPILIAAAGAVMLLAFAQSPVEPAAPVTQPIPYSHALHAGKLQLKCNFCHENKDPGEMMGIPATAKCMTCHESVKSDSPAIQKLAEWHKGKKDVPWARVYQIPGFVFFSHRAHTEAGASCQECHGNVAETPVLRRETDISMGGCMDCHRRHKAPLDCTYCHDRRN